MRVVPIRTQDDPTAGRVEREWRAFAQPLDLEAYLNRQTARGWSLLWISTQDTQAVALTWLRPPSE